MLSKGQTSFVVIAGIAMLLLTGLLLNMRDNVGAATLRHALEQQELARQDAWKISWQQDEIAYRAVRDSITLHGSENITEERLPLLEQQIADAASGTMTGGHDARRGNVTAKATLHGEMLTVELRYGPDEKKSFVRARLGS